MHNARKLLLGWDSRDISIPGVLMSRALREMGRFRALNMAARLLPARPLPARPLPARNSPKLPAEPGAGNISATQALI
jgi:hypothetical protein